MPHTAPESISTRRRKAVGRSAHQPPRIRDWSGLGTKEILARYRPGRVDPLQVLEVLIKLFNHQHTALMKSVSHKTRQERADFFRRFFRDLRARAGFKTLPDPRNLGERHIRAMVQIWRQDRLAPATIQTYFSFLRGLAQWIGKPGLVRSPAHYGLQIEEYQRHEAAERDKSWSAQGVNIEALIDEVCAYDAYVGAALLLIWAFGLRRKEALMLRPHACIVRFESTGMPESDRVAYWYLWIRQGSKNGRERYVPLSTPQRIAAIEHAKSVVVGSDAHMGDPSKDLKKNLCHFNYVLAKFGITTRKLGITAHGLRHEALIDEFIVRSGQQPPVRGDSALTPEAEAAARQAVARLAGHQRHRAASAYLGAARFRKTKYMMQT